jgi:hypothetical protein
LLHTEANGQFTYSVPSAPAFSTNAAISLMHAPLGAHPAQAIDATPYCCYSTQQLPKH